MAGQGKENSDFVAMHLAPAGRLGSPGHKRGLGRQEDRIGSIGVQE